MTAIQYPFMLVTIGGGDVTAELCRSKFFRLPGHRPVRDIRTLDVDDIVLLNGDDGPSQFSVADVDANDVDEDRHRLRQFAERWFWRYEVRAFQLPATDNPALVAVLKRLGGAR